MSRQPKLRPGTTLLTLALALAAMDGHAQVAKGCATGVDPATLGPKSIIGQGPNGEKAASVEQLQLTPEEIGRASCRERVSKQV